MHTYQRTRIRPCQHERQRTHKGTVTNKQTHTHTHRIHTILRMNTCIQAHVLTRIFLNTLTTQTHILSEENRHTHFECICACMRIICQQKTAFYTHGGIQSSSPRRCMIILAHMHAPNGHQIACTLSHRSRSMNSLKTTHVHVHTYEHQLIGLSHMRVFYTLFVSFTREKSTCVSANPPINTLRVLLQAYTNLDCMIRKKIVNNQIHVQYRYS